MTDFWIYFEKGLRHILDPNAYNHILFLVVLLIPYSFYEWKKVFLIITIFTISHSLGLLISIFDVIVTKADLVVFIIPFAVFLTGLYNLFTVRKSANQLNISFLVFLVLFVGIIHGLGFSEKFKIMVGDAPQSRLVPLAEFGLGIECIQIVVAFAVLMISYISQAFFRISRYNLILVISAFVIGVVLPMIIVSGIWYI
jgi:hypothetical protein